MSLQVRSAPHNVVGHAGDTHQRADVVDAHDIGAAVDADGDRSGSAFHPLVRAEGRGYSQ
jgi:hypothetical protein